MKPITETILELKPDMVALQEVYDRDAALALIETLGSEYAHFFYDVGPQTLGGNATGLFIASKVPIARPAFQWFPRGLHVEYWGGKGVIDVTVNNSKGEPLFALCDTHLQYSPDDMAPLPEEQRLRARQLDIIAQRIERIVSSERCSKLPVYVVGDMNIVYGSEEQSVLDASYHNLLPEEIRKDGTYTEERNGTHVRYAIDYPLLWKGNQVAAEPHEVQLIRKEELMSDHDALFFKIPARS